MKWINLLLLLLIPLLNSYSYPMDIEKEKQALSSVLNFLYF